MADTEDEPIIRAYIDRMLAIAKDDDEPDQAMLESIASELGLSDEDVQRANRLAADHHTRARHFLGLKRWDDALAELAQATALRPHDVDMRVDLAEAYVSRWEAERNGDDKVAAERLIRKVIEHEPDRKVAYTLLSRLDQRRSVRVPRVGIGVGAAIVVLAVILVSLDDGFLRPDKMLAKLWRQWNRSPVTQTVVPNEAPTKAPDTSSAPVTEVDIPLRLVSTGKGQGLSAVVRQSRLTRHQDPSLYNYALLLTNNGRTEIKKLGVQLTFRSAKGEALGIEKIDLINSADPPWRPGDEYAKGDMRLVPLATAAVDAEIVLRDEVAAPPSYAPASPQSVVWDAPKPSHISLAFRKRRETLKAIWSGGNKTFEGHYEVHNQGQGAINELAVTADILDRQGKRLKSKSRSIVYGNGRELAPGHVRAFQLFEFSLPETAEQVRLRVTEVQ
jgi:hypothetical protein